ncbi:MAG: hypothetical protein BroJett025_08710 [Patescibacteria group bacterium]|nr:MAG: hypothetical protein BroJett025_08710 [Patescibacteria group bacterium]
MINTVIESFFRSDRDTVNKKEETSSKFSDIQLTFAKELEELLGPEFSQWALSLPKDIFHQIDVLHQPGLLNSDQLQNHWDYELNMIKAVISHRNEILQLFEVEEVKSTEFLQDLIFMIVISDIGKAGPINYNPKHAAAVVPRIYNNLILEGKHGKSVKEIGIKTLFAKKVYGSTEVTKEIRRIIFKISGVKSVRFLRRIIFGRDSTNESVLEGLSPRVKEILKQGNVRALPIELAFIIAREIAIQEVLDSTQSDREKTQRIQEIKKCFVLSRAEKVFLLQQGFKPDTEPIGNFYTNSHIIFGKKFLFTKSLGLNEHFRERAKVGLRHHFVQGAFADSPKKMEEFIRASKIDAREKRDLRLVAFLEMLDKVEASLHRPAAGNPFTGEDPQKFLVAIESNLKQNYQNNWEYLFSVYKEVFESMQQIGIFETVKAVSTST